MLLHDLGSGVFTLHPFLTSEGCQAEIAWAEGVGFADAPVTTRRGPVHIPRIRNNTRVMRDDPEKAEKLWAILKPWIEPYGAWEPTGLNERFRYYKYTPGQRFAPHCDGYYERRPGERSLLTFLIYLNEGFEGGFTRFPHVGVRPKEGAALIFRHPILHEGSEITEGTKYVLRTDVMFKNEEFME